MDVKLVNFPQTKVAMIAFEGHPANEHDTVMKLVHWKIQNKLLDQSRFRSYGLHHLPKQNANSIPYRVDFCLSIEESVEPNEFGITESKIPECRCALARDIGSRMDNQAVKHLVHNWLPTSGEALSGLPIIFHYVNVGPNVKDVDAITDVYLPLL